MKRIFAFGLLMTLIIAFLSFNQGCKKQTTTTTPIISLKGNNPDYISLNAAYVEPGYLAHDETDGDITTLVKVAGASSVNVNLKGTYTINYSVMNSSGISCSATRTIIVRNDADSLIGNYTVIDSCSVTHVSFSDSIKTSSTQNDLLTIYNFAGNNDSLIGQFISQSDSIIFAQNQPMGTGFTFVSGYGKVVPIDTIINGNVFVKNYINVYYHYLNGIVPDSCVAHYTR